MSPLHPVECIQFPVNLHNKQGSVCLQDALNGMNIKRRIMATFLPQN